MYSSNKKYNHKKQYNMIKAYIIIPRMKIWSEVEIQRVKVSGASVGVDLLIGLMWW